MPLNIVVVSGYKFAFEADVANVCIWMTSEVLEVRNEFGVLK